MLGKSFSRIQSAALAYAILTVAADAADDLDCFDIGSAPDYNLDECAFAQKYCTDNVYSRTYYCSSGVGRGFFVAACVGWLGLLFVLLGSTVRKMWHLNQANRFTRGLGLALHESHKRSTYFMYIFSQIEFVHLNLTQADDYFSPALEQFSVKLGLPPRFAGVTLLALGNGAPDVSSTIASITAGGDGYLLSLGALTGAGMFVGTVVAGSVILAVGGVHARGAMIRDCTAYLATCCMVLYIFSSGDVSHGDVTLLLICYFAFIGTVLAADIYHRAVVLPRQKLLHDFMAGGLAAGTSSSSIDRGFEMGSAIRQLENLRPGFENAGSGGDTVAMRTADDHGPSSPVSAAPTPPSRATTDATPSGRAQNAHAPIAHARNKGGLLEGVTNKRAKYVIMHADDDDYEDADLDFAGLGGRELELDGYSTLEGSRHDEFKDLPSFAGEESGGYNNEPELSVVERFREKVSGGLEEFNEMSPSDKFLYLVEWPFTVARRFTVPITADDNYVKPYLILSVALMPLWFVGYYMDMATSMIGGSSSSRDDTRDDYDDPASPIDDANYDDGDDGSRALFTTRALGLSGPRTLNSRLLSATRQLSNESGDGGGFPVLLLAMMISCTAAAALYFKCSDSRPPPTIIAVSREALFEYTYLLPSCVYHHRSCVLTSFLKMQNPGTTGACWIRCRCNLD